MCVYVFVCSYDRGDDELQESFVTYVLQVYMCVCVCVCVCSYDRGDDELQKTKRFVFEYVSQVHTCIHVQLFWAIAIRAILHTYIHTYMYIYIHTYMYI